MERPEPEVQHREPADPDVAADGRQTPLIDPEERRVIYAALDSFYQYRKNAHYSTTHRRRQNLYALPTAQWNILADSPINILDTFNHVDDAIDYNADIAEAILQLGLDSFGLPINPPPATPIYWHKHAKGNDMSKAHSTLRQFYRDWSAEGYRAEVKPLLDLILSNLKNTIKHSIPLPSVLLPGAGLGRLLLELCLAGYSTTGNEISYHQLLASNFILNATHHANQYKLYPFATTFTNNLSRANQLRYVEIPDIHPSTTIASALQSGKRVGEMNMTAGDFVLSYSTPDEKSSFDAIVTVFFIDTAPNLIRYIQTVHHCLKPNGIWINIGPLLWHFDDRAPGPSEDDHQNNAATSSSASSTKPANMDLDEDTGIAEPGSFELTNDEVIHLLARLGFQVEKQEIISKPGVDGSGVTPTSETGGQSSPYGPGYGYIQDPNSMLQNTYRCSHWVARKVLTDPS